MFTYPGCLNFEIKIALGHSFNEQFLYGILYIDDVVLALEFECYKTAG